MAAGLCLGGSAGATGAPRAPSPGLRFLLARTSWSRGRRLDEVLALAHPHGMDLRWLSGSARTLRLFLTGTPAAGSIAPMDGDGRFVAQHAPLRTPPTAGAGSAPCS